MKKGLLLLHQVHLLTQGKDSSTFGYLGGILGGRGLCRLTRRCNAGKDARLDTLGRLPFGFYRSTTGCNADKDRGSDEQTTAFLD
jgi:hypothetical protein